MNIIMSSLLALNFSASAEAVTNQNVDQYREPFPIKQQTLPHTASEQISQWNAVSKETGYRQFVIQVFGPRGYNRGALSKYAIMQGRPIPTDDQWRKARIKQWGAAAFKKPGPMWGQTPPGGTFRKPAHVVKRGTTAGARPRPGDGV